ncbi:hypothetical protein F5X68DRAFT_199314 [Plectosphaerella plurivora]|uniref:Secreted protein n=1 Tax=Plectosphaerella plurivora TaxID=936078 RepID=A0A9P8VH59_9PEZI|nr:hypothetical protein F5X68DRAFT_199314 [Plectosphaerella plurivora]
MLNHGCSWCCWCLWTSSFFPCPGDAVFIPDSSPEGAHVSMSLDLDLFPSRPRASRIKPHVMGCVYAHSFTSTLLSILFPGFDAAKG